VPVTETLDQPRPTGDRFDILDICLIATFAQILLVRLNHALFRRALDLGAAEARGSGASFPKARLSAGTKRRPGRAGRAAGVVTIYVDVSESYRYAEQADHRVANLRSVRMRLP
jgi:hypothetical protein